MNKRLITRRNFLRGTGLVAASTTLAGCDQFDFLRDRDGAARNFLEGANSLTYHAQRLLLGRDALAREYAESEIRQGQRPNGSRNPSSSEYRTMANGNFASYRLEIGGLVENPVSFSLNELRNMPARTQITRHDCVEGWSCIAKWAGPQLGPVLDQAGVKPEAKYVVFRCYDSLGNSLSGPNFYYESCDLIDARHPQTILAHTLNDNPLPVANGAPLRVRIERQLGYKMAKYIRRIELVSDFSDIEGGHGGYWEDRGYEWFAGI